MRISLCSVRKCVRSACEPARTVRQAEHSPQPRSAESSLPAARAAHVEAGRAEQAKLFGGVPGAKG